jgi:hypothetical protein
MDIDKDLQKMLDRNISIMEAAEKIATKYNIEIESVASVISKNAKFKSILYKEASELNLLKDKKNNIPEDI